jgi:hypothetical protein
MKANGGGVIVNTASEAGLVGTPQASAYVAAKHAVERRVVENNSPIRRCLPMDAQWIHGGHCRASPLLRIEPLPFP